MCYKKLETHFSHFLRSDRRMINQSLYVYNINRMWEHGLDGVRWLNSVNSCIVVRRRMDTEQYTYNVYIEARPCKHCCSGKAIRIIYIVCVCIQYFDTHLKMHTHHIVSSGLSGSTRFFHIISQTAQFSEKKAIGNKMCLVIFSAAFVQKISHSKKNWERFDQIYTILRVHPLFLSDFNGNLILSTNFRKIIKNATNKMQRYRLIYYSLSALHVSGDVFAHYQENLTVQWCLG
jgi:hypothetical protein